MLANYRTAEVLGHGFGPDPQKPACTYLKGNLAKAYGEKAREIERSFVFLNLRDQPVRAALVVFDRVVSTDPSLRKYWLLHSMEKPEIADSSITIAPRRRAWEGKLVNQVVLPARADITPVGGPGKEFWVFGKNFFNQVKEDSAAFEIGEWRVEVSTREPSAEDHFLNVMQVMDRSAAPLPVTRLEADDRAGILIAGSSVLFRKSGGVTDRPVKFRSEGRQFLVTDLAGGSWQLWRDGTVARPAIRVSAEEGTLWFEGPPGMYELRR